MSTGTPRVLVLAASRHGATGEIAAALAHSIEDSDAGRAAGLSAVPMPADQRPDPSPFVAVVIGSAVYAGRWLEPAREFATAHADILRTRPVWLFSSGPIGDPPFPPDEPHEVAALTHLTGARGHMTFPGRLEKARLSFGERAMISSLRAPVGDSRDWAAVRAWGEELATQIAGIDRSTAVGT